MISYSGVKHGPDTVEQPPVRDVAIGLARLPRWCGQTKAPFSVLQHSLVAADLLRPHGVELELAGLTHDFEEGLGWGDISSSLKPDSVRHAQHQHRKRWLVSALSQQAGDWRPFRVSLLWNHPLLKEADQASGDAERYLMMDGKGPLDEPGATSMQVRALSLLTRYGYSQSGLAWDPAQQVQYLVSEFERLQRELYALWSTTPGLLLGTVASVPTGGQGPDSAGSPAEHPDRPATARGVLGRVVDAATGDQESERVSARVVGIDRSPYFRCSEVSYDGVPADQCSSCGAWYDHGSEHACHPEAGGAA